MSQFILQISSEVPTQDDKKIKPTKVLRKMDSIDRDNVKISILLDFINILY